jgi:hypothetical protein
MAALIGCGVGIYVCYGAEQFEGSTGKYGSRFGYLLSLLRALLGFSAVVALFLLLAALVLSLFS